MRWEQNMSMLLFVISSPHYRNAFEENEMDNFLEKYNLPNELRRNRRP